MVQMLQGLNEIGETKCGIAAVSSWLNFRLCQRYSSGQWSYGCCCLCSNCQILWDCVLLLAVIWLRILSICISATAILVGLNIYAVCDIFCYSVLTDWLQAVHRYYLVPFLPVRQITVCIISISWLCLTLAKFSPLNLSFSLRGGRLGITRGAD